MESVNRYLRDFYFIIVCIQSVSKKCRVHKQYIKQNYAKVQYNLKFETV